MTTSTKHYHIVLADDDEDDRSFFRDAIEQLPAASKLQIFNDGQKILNYLFEEEALPDIIFLDLHMPKRDGMECLKEIRSQLRFNQVPVVMFTLAGQAPVSKDPQQPAADKYIEKSGSFNTLVETLRAILCDEGYKALRSNSNPQSI